MSHQSLMKNDQTDSVLDPRCAQCAHPAQTGRVCEPVELDAHKAKSQKRISSSGRPPNSVSHCLSDLSYGMYYIIAIYIIYILCIISYIIYNIIYIYILNTCC